MIKQGLLDKHGKPSDSTPATWMQEYVDYRRGWLLASPAVDRGPASMPGSLDGRGGGKGVELQVLDAASCPLW